MPLIVEDGTIVAGANSFATLTELRTYAAERGVVLSAVDAEVEVLSRKAMDWLAAQERTLAGCRVDREQTLPFPRSGVTVHGFSVASDEIPALAKELQLQATLDASSVDLLPTHAATPAGAIKKEVVDVLETEYYRAGTSSLDFAPVLTKLDDLLRPLQTGRGLGLNVSRG